MNEIAKGHYDLALQWMNYADEVEDINNTIAYTGLAECALKMAQFAVDNPDLVGAVLMPEGVTVPVGREMPPGPEGGPKLWGHA